MDGKKTKYYHLGDKDSLVILTLILVGIIIYSPGLNAPWYADDFFHIVDNAKINDFQYWITQLISDRGLVKLSFAANFHWFGTDIVGYHLCNLAIHLVSSVVVFYLLLRVFEKERWLSLGGALIFLVHPLQTQAVTYVVQRSTSLATMFVLLGVLFWCRFRENGMPSYLHFLPVLFCGLLALLSKANTVVFPFLLALFDYYFLKGQEERPGKSWRFFIVLFFCVSIISLKIISVGQLSEMVPVLSSGPGVGGHQSNAEHMPKVLFFEHATSAPDGLIGTFEPVNLQGRYLATEFIVLWEYVRLLMLPVNQLLDYSYPLVDNILNWKTGLSFLSLVCVISFFWLKRLRYLIFGVSWFLLSLAVESTLIPLDPLFEHRLYLPMFGFVVMVMSIIRMLKSYQLRFTVVASIILILSLLTINRNNLWANPILFWQDHVEQVPGSYRVWHHLGSEYVKAGRYRDAIPCFLEALSLDAPVPAEINANLGLAYLESGDRLQAIASFEKALKLNIDDPGVHSNLGTVLFDLGFVEKALYHLEKAVEINPLKDSYLLNLAAAHVYLRRYEKASMIYNRVLELYSKHPQALHGLEIVERRGVRGGGN